MVACTKNYSFSVYSIDSYFLDGYNFRSKYIEVVDKTVND